jgi:hypothetical protein
LAGSAPKDYSNWNKTKTRRFPSPFNASAVCYLAGSCMYCVANLKADFGFSGTKPAALGTSNRHQLDNTHSLQTALPFMLKDEKHMNEISHAMAQASSFWDVTASGLG